MSTNLDNIKLIDKMDELGIDKFITLYQEQLDAWLETTGSAENE